MKRAWIAGAVLVLVVATLLGRLGPPVVTIDDIGVTELYVDLASQGRLLVGPYSRFFWHHPGPLYFYLQAPLYVAAGGNGVALFAGAWALNVAAFVLMLWILRAERSAAVTLGVGAAVLISAWRLSPLLASPWTAHVVILPLLAFLTATASAAAGRTALLPVVALLASFLVQTNLALAPAVAVPLALLALTLVPHLLSSGPRLRHVAQAAAVALIVWLPPIIEMVVNRGGNGAALWTFFSTGGAPHSFGEAFAAWSFSTAGLVRPHLELPWGKAIDPSGAQWTAFAAVALAALLAVITVSWLRARRPFEAWLGTMVFASLVAVLWSVTRIRDPIGDYQVLSATSMGATAAGMVLARTVQVVFRAVESDRFQRVTAAAAAVMGIGVAALALVHFQQAVALQRRLPWAADVVPAVERIEAYLDAKRPRAILIEVDRAWSQGVAIVLRLRRDHWRVAVTPSSRFIFTDAFAPTGREDAAIVIRPGRQPLPAGTTPIFDSWSVGVVARTP